MTELLANLATTTLAADITTIGQPSCAVVSDGAFPSSGNFRIRIGSEIMIVSDVSGSNILGGLTRGAEGTAPTVHTTGDPVRQVLTRDGLAQLILDGAGASDPQLATLAGMDDTHATTYVGATPWGLALLLDVDATDTKTALGLNNVENTADIAKPVSTLQAKADATVTRNPQAASGTYDVLPADIGKSVDLGFSGAQTATLRTATAVGISAGQWFDIVNTNATGVKTFAWEAGVTVRSPVTGTAIAGASSTPLAVYERLRLYYIGSNIWSIVGRPAGSVTGDVTMLKEAAANIEDPTYTGSAAVGAPIGGAALGNGAANRSALVALADYLAPFDGVEMFVPPGKFFEVGSPGAGANLAGFTMHGQTTLNLAGYLTPTGTWGTDGAVVKFGATTGGQQIQDCYMHGAGHIDCTGTNVPWAVWIDVLRRGKFRDFKCDTPTKGMIRVTNTSTTQDSDSITFDSLNMLGSGAAWVPSRFMVFDGTGTKVVSDMTVANCKCQGGLLAQTTAGTLTTGGWAFECINASRIEFNGGNFCCHHTAGAGNTLYSGGWLLRSTAGQNCDDCVITNPYCEATIAGGGTVNAAWSFNTVRLEVTSGAGSVSGTKIEGLHQSVATPSGAGVSRRLALERLAASGTIEGTKFRNPRTPVGANNPDSYFIGSGCTNNYIETLSGADIGPDVNGNTGEPWTNNGGTTNRKRGLTGALNPLQTYAATGITTDRTYNNTATTLGEVGNVLGTLISDLRAQGLIQ